MARGTPILNWNPEDELQWQAGNAGIARRNLIWSIINVHVSFSVWYLWSVMMLLLPRSVYHLGPSDKFLLAATASLVGATLRIPFPMLNARFGGRNWATFSSLILMVPTIFTIVLVAKPGLPLWMFVLCAALTGLGGANYSASLANVESFYPQRRKGFALGLTGGLANLGSASIQAVGLIVLASVGHQAPYVVCAIYLVLLAIGGIGAALFMNNLGEYRIDRSHMKAMVKVPDSWGISILYMVFSGSFLGFAFAFGQLLQHNFLESGQTHAQASLHAAEIAFTGPLLGSLARIVGGRVSDHFGGARVALFLLVCMVGGGTVLALISGHDDHVAMASHGHHHLSLLTNVCYVASFIALFIFGGAGKGAVYKLIPSFIEMRSRTLGISSAERVGWCRVRSGALIGFAGSFGAFGSVVINLVLRQSFKATGSDTPAFWVFLGCYIAVAILCWVRYVRPEATSVPEPLQQSVMVPAHD